MVMYFGFTAGGVVTAAGGFAIAAGTAWLDEVLADVWPVAELLWPVEELLLPHANPVSASAIVSAPMPTSVKGRSGCFISLSSFLEWFAGCLIDAARQLAW
jgi:hypothetical protein